MASQKSEIEIIAKDEATQKFSKLEIGLNKLKAAAVGLAAAGFAALTVALGKSITLAAEQERVLAQMDATLRSTGNAVGLTKKEIVALSGELQKTSGIGDEVIQTGENMLLTFTNIREDVFKETTKVLLDMNVAMTDGNVTQESMRNQAIQLGKALNDPVQGISALTRVGVKFTDQQKDAIKEMVSMGKVADAQKIILQELQTEFGGSAEALGETFSGSITGLKSSIGDLGEEIGFRLIPWLKDAAKELTNFVSKAVGYLSKLRSERKKQIDEFKKLGNEELNSLIKNLEKEIEARRNTSYVLKLLRSGENVETVKQLEKRLKLVKEALNQITKEEKNASKERNKNTQDEEDKNTEIRKKSLEKINKLGLKFGQDFKSGVDKIVNEVVVGDNGIQKKITSELSTVIGATAGAFAGGAFGSIIANGVGKLVGGIFGGGAKTVDQIAEEKFKQMIDNTNRKLEDLGRERTTAEKQLDILKQLESSSQFGAQGIIPERFLASLGLSAGTTIEQGKTAILDRILNLEGRETSGVQNDLNTARQELQSRRELEPILQEIDQIESRTGGRQTERSAQLRRQIQGFDNRLSALTSSAALIENQTSITALNRAISELSGKLSSTSNFTLDQVAEFIRLSNERAEITGSTPKFAGGGKVPGSSFQGDRVQVKVNSGERILTSNTDQQLFDTLKTIQDTLNGSNGKRELTVNLVMGREVLARQLIDISAQRGAGLI